MDAPRFFSPFYRQRLNAVGSALLFSLAVLTWHFSYILIAVLILLAVLFFVFSRRFDNAEMRKVAACFCIGIIAALLVSGVNTALREKLDALCDRKIAFSGIVTARTDKDATVRLFSLEESAAWELCSVTSLPDSIAVGDVVRGSAVFSAARDTLRQNGVFFTVNEKSTFVKTGKAFLLSGLYAARDRAKQSLPSTREGAFWRAVLFGDRSALSPTDIAAHRRLGVSHLLAISGLHVNVAVSMAFSVLRLFPIPRRVRGGLMIVLISATCFICGESIPVLRAACMASLAHIALLFSRRVASFTSLVFAASLIAIIQPLSLFSPSFLLSFAASGAILTVAAPLTDTLQSTHLSFQSRRRLLSLCLFLSLLGISGFLVSAAAFAATFPLQLLLFGEVQVFSPLYSVFLVFLFTPVLFCGVIGALLSAVFSVSFPLSHAVLSPFLLLVETLAHSAPAQVFVPTSLAQVSGAVFLLWMLAIYAFRARRSALYLLYCAETVFGVILLLFL